MAEEPNVPLSAIRGLGPLDAARITACGIQTANQLASTPIAEFKQRCPQLHRKAGSFIKGARTAVRRVCTPPGAPLSTTPGLTTDEALTATSHLGEVKQARKPPSQVLDTDKTDKKESKKRKKAKKAHSNEKAEKKDKKKDKKSSGKEKKEKTAAPDKQKSGKKKRDKKKDDKKRSKEKS